MALLKKTIVLTNNGVEGYITVVRVGDEVGAKIVGAAFKKGMTAAIKIGAEPVIYAKLDGERTEINMNISFNQNDEISCLIMEGEMLIAKAGRSLSKRELIEYFSSMEVPIIIPSESIPVFVEQNITQNPPIEEKLNELEFVPKEEKLFEAETPKEEKLSEVDIAPKMQDTTAYADEEVVQKRPSPSKNAKPKNNNPPVVENADIVAPTVSEPSIVEEIPTQELVEKTENIDSDAEKEFLSRLHSTGTKNFYQNVKERLEDLFIIHPRENELEKLIPESKWVKIRYDGDDYYVVGSLTDDGTVAYLAYGVPGIAEIPPPKLASDISDWLPVPNLPPPYKGYWLIFQNAEDGKVGNIK